MSPAHTTTETDQALCERIVEAARALFLEHGYSKVSASEIASALGISKKTLYRNFETKEDILRAVVFPKLKESSKRLDAVLSDGSLSFPKKLEQVLAIMGTQQQRVTPVFIRDVAVHAPGVWKEIHEHKQGRLKKFGTLLEEGIRLGYFRSDIPGEVIVRMHTAAVESMMTPQAVGELPCTLQEVFRNIVTILFEGILSEGKRKSFVRPSVEWPAK